MADYKVLEEALGKLPKVELGFYPTPLQKLANITKDYGVEVYMKRDDFSGMNVYGGNKMRKLEYLMGDAIQKGADVVYTYGATQSNHAMQTATAARKCGMYPVLWLSAIVKPDEDDVRANMLLDTIFGAEIHVYDPKDAGKLKEMTAARTAELEAEGHKVYDIPGGGASDVGTSGFAGGLLELLKQFDAMGKKPDYIFTTTGSGGTLGGLVAAKVAMGADVKIVGILVSGNNYETYKQLIVDKANEALALMGIDKKATFDDFEIDTTRYGEGYEIPYQPANDAIRKLAREEGILADPVYSGKGFGGMLAWIEEGKIKKGETVCFLHTGGTTALFAEKEIVGDLSKNV